MNDTPAQADNANKPKGITRAGIVEKPVAVLITSGFSGRISDIYVTEGEAVKAGQPLFKIEALSVGKEVPASQDNYENALKEYNRLQKLYEQGAIPRRQLENAAARLQAAQQSRQSGQNANNAPQIITAPVDGIVAALAAAAGSAVEAGQHVMALGSGQKIEIVVPLEQKELYLVHLGTPAAVEAADQVIKGQVSSIFPEIQESKVSAFLAHIKLINPPDGLLKAGMPVNVRIDTDQ